MAALYQQRILDHSRHPRRFGPLPGASHRAPRDNPFCGDALAVAAIALSPDGIGDIRFEGAGCAIAMAAASMMAEAVAGRPRAEVEALAASLLPLRRRRAGRGPTWAS